ncbi:MAG: STAS/SEC14 domain-containing protein [Gammaproteobacteria bacterium]|nr:STAS/SEC14 domain-containing protein [Gammaproteobacteria bacterium]
MLHIKLDAEHGIAVFSPEGALSEADFEAAAGIIDPYLEEHDKLAGLIIETKTFPGWESFGALVGHLKFIKNHHNHLSHVALVTDSALGDLGEKIGRHFVAAEIKHYPYDQFDAANKWILQEQRPS